MRALLSLLVATATLFVGCAGESEPAADTIDRERFIEAWVELRSEAINARRGAVDEATRTAVLDRVRVTEEDLVTFAEVHGTDGAYMREVWNEVSDRLEGRTFEPTVPMDTAR